MKNENILLIGGGLVAAWWLLGKRKDAIGVIYPNLENSIQADVVNEYLPAALTLKEANFSIKKRRLAADDFSQLKSKDSALDMFSQLADIDKDIRMPQAGIKFIFVFLNKQNRPIDYEVYDKLPNPSKVLQAALSTVCSGVVLFSLTKVNPIDVNVLSRFLKQLRIDFETAGIPFMDYIEMTETKVTSALEVGVFGIGSLTYRLRRGPNVQIPNIQNIGEVRDFFRKVIGSRMLMQELAVIIYVDKQKNPIAYSLHSIGGSDATMMDGKILFGAALKMGADGIIISHNHPSGINRPSQADLNITEKLVKVGKSVGVKLIDHIIVTNTEKYYSFSENNLV